MKRAGLILLVVMLTWKAGLSIDPESLVRQGNTFYTEAQYERAVETYEAVIDSGFISSELYFNLGNAYFKSHDITMALVNYERALILDPNDKEIVHNLGIAREFVVDRIEVLPEFFLRTWFRGFVRILDTDLWAIISLASFIAALCLLIVYFFSPRLNLRKMSFWMAVFLVIVSITCFVFASENRNMAMNHNRAIIQTSSVTIKSSPDEQSGSDLFLLHEGTSVTVEDELGEWREVVLSDGNRGWLKESDLIML